MTDAKTATEQSRSMAFFVDIGGGLLCLIAACASVYFLAKFWLLADDATAHLKYIFLTLLVVSLLLGGGIFRRSWAIWKKKNDPTTRSSSVDPSPPASPPPTPNNP